MAVPSWPVGLPYAPRLEGYQVSEPHRSAKVTEYEDGPERMRPASNTVIQRMAYRIVLETPAQYDTWRTFAVATLNKGTSRFTMPVPSPGQGSGFTSRTCYLENGAWNAERTGASGWLISFTLCAIMV